MISTPSWFPLIEKNFLFRVPSFFQRKPFTVAQVSFLYFSFSIYSHGKEFLWKKYVHSKNHHWKTNAFCTLLFSQKRYVLKRYWTKGFFFFKGIYLRFKVNEMGLLARKPELELFCSSQITTWLSFHRFWGKKKHKKKTKQNNEKFILITLTSSSFKIITENSNIPMFIEILKLFRFTLFFNENRTINVQVIMRWNL